MEDILLEPLKAYTSHYEQAFDANAQAYFDDLVKKSRIDVEANRATVKAYKKQLAAIERVKSKLSGHKTGRGFLIFLIVLGVIAAALGIYQIVTGGDALWAIAIAVGIAAFIAPIIVIVKVLNPRIARFQKEIEQLTEKANDLFNEANAQMRPLNELFESGATKELIEKTVPKLVLDENFDVRRYDYLHGKYGYSASADIHRSTVDVLSGEILGNPYVVEHQLVETMGTKRYTGTLVIHWTTTYTDSQGHSRTQHHTQTLFATVDKPCPYYDKRTYLVYGNDAAPQLSFTHEPSHAERHSEEELERKVKRGAKKIQKKQRKNVSAGTAFTEMGNSEFDVLFGALDRNNEVEFRLLFTPLAQKNMLELMKSDDAFGDDFFFRKEGCLNYIMSEHAKSWELDCDYRRYQSYDIDTSKQTFMSYNKYFFKSLYFELAPLLSIPLYQQQKPREYIYKTEYATNYTAQEVECVLNNMGSKHFAPSGSSTPSILKTGAVVKDGKTDEVTVTAYAYHTEPRVDFVPILGGDGMIHPVPVPWDEYIPVSRGSLVKVKQLELTDKQFREKRSDEEFLLAVTNAHKIGYYHKLLCCLMRIDDDGFDEAVNDAVD